MYETIVRDETSYRKALAMLATLDIGKMWRVTVKRYQAKRTLEQNALLHMWLGIIADDTGNSIDDVKEIYRDMFLGKVSKVFAGEEYLVGRSTTDLDVPEMSDLLDKIHAHATTELGIRLPLPEERTVSDEQEMTR